VRVLALDLGSKRIGVAVSDGSGTIATPLVVVTRSGDRALDHRRIAALVAEQEAERVVVGLPLSLDGRRGPAADAAQTEVELLAAALPVPVETFDERLTTVTAERVLVEAGLRAEARRKVVDKVAAAVILQAWLDRREENRPARGEPEGRRARGAQADEPGRHRRTGSVER
jgi:putative pre-16S rRNA nuclease